MAIITKQKIEILLSIPKSLYFCCMSMPLKDALRIPVFVSRRTVIRSLKGSVKIGGKLHQGMIRIGFGGSGTALHKPCSIENNGLMILGNHVNFGGGVQICTALSSSVISIGDESTFTGESHIVAKKRIEIGCDCIISWDTQIMDTDYHDIVQDGRVINKDQSISVGDHVWICSRSCILKGSKIAEGTIVSAGAIIQGNIVEKNTVITGMPVRIMRRGCYWKHTDIFKAG